MASIGQRRWADLRHTWTGDTSGCELGIAQSLRVRRTVWLTPGDDLNGGDGDVWGGAIRPWQLVRTRPTIDGWT